MMFSIRYRYLFVLLLSVYSFLNIKFTEGYRLFIFELADGYFFGILFFIVILVWEGNRLIENNIIWLQSRLPGKIHPLIILFVISIINVLFISFVPIYLIVNFIDSNPLDRIFHMKLALGFGFRINLFLNSINAIFYFMSQYKKKEIEAEALKKISIESQFEALRTQINPHFLFNSFNVLSTLVYKDPETSYLFIQQLSKVYRYLLDGHQKKLVTLTQELEFINSYIFLLSIRFKNNLKINNQIPDNLKDYYIAPASLQMLIENAIKHNIVSIKHPLNIDLYAEDTEYIVVENNLQEKKLEEKSTSIGLRNIKSRYEFISDKTVEVIKNASKFTVKVPIIELKEI